MLTDNLNWLTSQNELSAGIKILLSLGKQFSGFCYLLSLNERLSGPLIWVTTFMLFSNRSFTLRFEFEVNSKHTKFSCFSHTATMYYFAKHFYFSKRESQRTVYE